ncbi:MAG: G/U mismatch-specific DNA glycosylase [Gemmataceae bacterium]
MSKTRRPTRQEIAEASQRTLEDVIGPGLRVLFVGINPGLYSAAIGHHFGRPGNRFWPAIHGSGFTPRLYSPYEDHDLLALKLGITNMASRASARADELSLEELVEGGQILRRKVERFQPRYLAFLGLGAYRTSFSSPRATIGLQSERIGETRMWVLPSPSGLNAHHSLNDLVALFHDFRREVDGEAAES